MKPLKLRIRFVQLMFLISLASCFAYGLSAQQANSETQQETKLLFVNYAISKSEPGLPQVMFMSKTIADGRLKDHSNKIPLNGDGDIECLQFDKHNKILERSYITNPLRPIVEYINDDGALEKRQLDIDRAEFGIKLQLDGRTVGIRLMLVDATGNATTELITTTIP